jgi:hypothetical protein
LFDVFEHAREIRIAFTRIWRSRFQA